MPAASTATAVSPARLPWPRVALANEVPSSSARRTSRGTQCSRGTQSTLDTGVLLQQRALVLAQAAVKPGDQEQGCDRAHEQAADYGTAEWGVLLTAIAETERHRQHADDHRQRRHQDGSQPPAARGRGGLTRRHGVRS